MTQNSRVLYLPPTLAGRQRTGTVRAVSGVSALVRFDDCVWPQWAPIARLLPILDVHNGWAQILLVTETTWIEVEKEKICEGD